MARKEPELFYHPVMGGFSPATIGMLDLQAFRPPSVKSGAEIATAHLPEAGPVSASHLETPFLAPYSERKVMTLLKTATCAVSGEILPQNRMIRFVISPDHRVVADLTGKLPGKFLWIAADRHTIKKAIWRNSFASASRDTVEIPEDLLEIIENGLSKLALQSLSMAKRAGELAFGFTKTDEALRSHKAQVYVVANDSSENGREKLERLAKHQEVVVIENWTCNELSAAIGEQNINHLALTKGGLAQHVVELVTKLNSVRSEK